MILFLLYIGTVIVFIASNDFSEVMNKRFVKVNIILFYICIVKKLSNKIFSPFLLAVFKNNNLLFKKIIYGLISIAAKCIHYIYIQSAVVGIDSFIFKTNRVMQNSLWNNTIKLYTIITYYYYKLLLFWTYTQSLGRYFYNKMDIKK